MKSPHSKWTPFWLIPLSIASAAAACVGLVYGFIAFSDWAFQ